MTFALSPRGRAQLAEEAERQHRAWMEHRARARRRRQMLLAGAAGAAAALLLLLVATAARAEEKVCEFTRSGLGKANFEIRYYVNGTATADPGITITAKSCGTSWCEYLVAGLPDAAAGSSTSYHVSIEDPVAQVLCPHSWPFSTRTPQAVVWNPVYQLAPGSGNVRAGDTQPDVELTLSGLPADPTGGSVTFTLYRPNMTVPVAAARAVSSLTRSGATATVDMAAAHEYSTNDRVTIAGATPATYNGTHTITVTDADSFTFPITGSPTSPATGTITAARLIQDRPASLVDVDQVVDAITGDTTWTAVVRYRWRAGDTTSLLVSPGPTTYVGQFEITLAAATCGDGNDPCVLTGPPDQTATIKVH